MFVATILREHSAFMPPPRPYKAGDGRFRVCVAGGRVGVLQLHLFKVLDACLKRWGESGFPPDRIELGQGEAAGVDRNSRKWAEARRLGAIARFPINDDLDGHDQHVIGKNRNSRMLRDFSPHLLIGFPGAGGTNDMMAKCHGAGVPVWDVEIEADAKTFAIRQWPTVPGERSTLIMQGRL